MLKKVSIFSVFLSVLVWFVWPYYGFFAYKGKVPILTFDYVDIPSESPTSSYSHKPHYHSISKWLEGLLREHKQAINAPGISAAVAIDGEVVWTGTSGWADIETRNPVSKNTQFRIGSTSKVLTSAGLARLVDKRVIDLNLPISNYAPELPNTEWQEITVRQLASHTAGIPHYKENSDFWGMLKTLALTTHYDDVNDAVAIFDDSDLLFPPGTRFSYSSLGTVLLSKVMQDAAKQPYQTIMRDMVFEPLGLHNTMPEPKDKSNSNLATFYWNNQGAQSEVTPWRDVDLSHRLAGGGFISTSSELVKIGSSFLNSAFISRDTRELFWTPQYLPDGSEPPFGYSVGWRVIEKNLGEGIGQVKIVNHGGVSRGAQCWLMVLPEYNMSVAVNINSNTEVFWDFGRISLDIAKAFILADSPLH